MSLIMATVILWVSTPVNFDVPADRANEAIIVWSFQARLQVLYDALAAGEWRTQSVKGRFEPVVALELMLKHTNLHAGYTTPRTVAVWEFPRYCHPEWGAAAPLPPCVQKPLEIRAPATEL